MLYFHSDSKNGINFLFGVFSLYLWDILLKLLTVEIPTVNDSV